MISRKELMQLLDVHRREAERQRKDLKEKMQAQIDTLKKVLPVQQKQVVRKQVVVQLPEAIPSTRSADVEILMDKTSGKRYSYNNTTKESVWLKDQEEEQTETLVDETSGKQYTWNKSTGEVSWLDD